jgi:parvulin-like peptidyl-prolyl isomerase
VQQFAGGLNDRGGFLGTVDIRTYVPRVRESLRYLHEGEYTGPIRVGDKYVIYKRVKKVVS